MQDALISAAISWKAATGAAFQLEQRAMPG